MFHFSRRTLWIIIYLTIPLIYILNSLGPDESSNDSEPEVVQFWSLDDVGLDCDDRFCSLALPEAKYNRLTVISELMPTTQIEVPAAIEMSVTQRGGFFISTLQFPQGLKSAKQATNFIEQWIPPSSSQKIVVSGHLGKQAVAQLKSLLKSTFAGSGIPYIANEPAALGLLKAPATGSSEQLPFLMWVEVLKKRLASYELATQWDHRRKTSYVLFNSTLSEGAFYPVDASELAPIVSAYKDTAALRQRTSEQLHRYAVTAAVYGLSFDFFTTQPARLEALTLASVNEMREFSLGQIQQ